MVAIHETAYPRIKSNLTANEIKFVFSPTSNEIAWVKKQRIKKQAWPSYIVGLKIVQRLHYFPALSKIPISITNHIYQLFSLTPPEKSEQIFSSKKAYQRAQESIRKYCGLKKFDRKEDKEWLTIFADDTAKTKESAIDIINVLIEALTNKNFELPALSFLERIATGRKSDVNEKNYNNITTSLSQEAQYKLLSLLKSQNDEGQYLWHKLKTEPGKPGNKKIAAFIQHSGWLKSIHDSLGNLAEISENKRQQYVFEAKSFDAGTMRELKLNKRIAYIALLVDEQFHFATDCIIDMFIKEIRKLHNRGKEALKQYQSSAANESEILIAILRNVAFTVNGAEEKGVIEKIMEIFDSSADKIMERCDLLVGGLNNYLIFLEKRYTAPVRKTLLDSLLFMDINQTGNESSLIECLNFVLHYRKANLATIRLDGIETEGDPNKLLDWLGERWLKVIFDSGEPNIINRTVKYKLFELAVFSEIATRLRAGDLYVSKSRKYEDYRTNLVSWGDYKEKIEDFCKTMDLPTSATDFINTMKENFLDRSKETDCLFKNDQYVTFDNGNLKLKKRPTKIESAEFKKLDQVIRESLPETNIVDLLIDTAKWINLEAIFKPASGNKTKIKNYEKHLIATIFVTAATSAQLKQQDL